MKSGKTVMVLSLGALALAPVLGHQAAAQMVSAQPGFVGMTKSSVAGCPNIGWRLIRHSDNTVTGIAYYADASGVSAVTGTSGASGQFSLKLASTMGKGPEGTVTGQRAQDGGLVADLKGDGCANLHLKVRGVPNINNAAGG